MNEEGIPDLNGIARIIEATNGTLAELKQYLALTPEDALDRVESRKTKRILRDIKRIKKQGKELGIDQEGIEDLIVDVFRRHTRTSSYERTLALAAPMIEHPENATRIDPEWLDAFRNNTETVYDEDVRRIWAVLLAGEIDNQGSFSKRTMSTLKDMSKSDASAFEKLCSFSIDVSELSKETRDPLPILFQDTLEGSATYMDGILSLMDLTALESLGLITILGIERSLFFEVGTSHILKVGDIMIEVANKGGEDKKLKFKNFSLTPLGKELSKLCNLGNGDGFLDRIISDWKSKGLSLSEVRLVEKGGKARAQTLREF